MYVVLCICIYMDVEVSACFYLHVNVCKRVYTGLQVSVTMSRYFYVRISMHGSVHLHGCVHVYIWFHNSSRKLQQNYMQKAAEAGVSFLHFGDGNRDVRNARPHLRAV